MCVMPPPSCAASDATLILLGVQETVVEADPYPTFHEIVQANTKKFGYDGSLEHFYRSRRVHRCDAGKRGLGIPGP